MHSLYEEYALLDEQEKAIKKKKEQLKSALLGQMNEQGQGKIETAVGKFSITRLKKWTYPEAVETMGEKFKAAKAKAESTGDATYEENDSLCFTPVKL